MIGVPALYEATVVHQRATPVRNRFRYRTYLWLVDPERPPRLPWMLRPLARFRTDDHVDVRAVLRTSGLEVARMDMLTNARTFGYVFNPITMFYCYDAHDELVATVAEVHNTYGGRHAYVLPPTESGTAEVAKALYVSPFYPVDGRYRITCPPPDGRLSLAVTLHREGETPFVATLRGRRLPLTARTLLRLSLRYPWAPLRVSALIRRQGIRLWRRGLQVQPR